MKRATKDKMHRVARSIGYTLIGAAIFSICIGVYYAIGLSLFLLFGYVLAPYPGLDPTPDRSMSIFLWPLIVVATIGVLIVSILISYILGKQIVKWVRTKMLIGRAV